MAGIQLSAVYVGTVVGAGFATGREIVEFFTRFGFYGFIGIILSGFLFSYIGMEMMLLSRKINAKSFQDLNDYLFGYKFSSFMNVLMTFMLLGVTSVMLSGAGALFDEQFGIPKQVGILLTIFLGLVVMFGGVKGLFSVNMLFVPMLILFTIIIGGETLIQFQDFSIPVSKSITSVIFSAILYSSSNLLLTQAVLVPLGREMRSERSIKIGTLLGGGVLAFILLCNQYALLNLPGVLNYEIPMAAVIEGNLPRILMLYNFIIYGEIFSSIIGNLYGLERQLIRVIKLPSIIIVGFVLFFSYFISLIGYGKLLSTLYTLNGYISLGFILLLIIKRPKYDFY